MTLTTIARAALIGMLGTAAGLGTDWRAAGLARETPLSFAGWATQGRDSGEVRVRCFAGGGLVDSTRIEAHLSVSGAEGAVTGALDRVWKVGGADDMWDVAFHVPTGQVFEVRGVASAQLAPNVLESAEWTISGKTGEGVLMGHGLSLRRRIGSQWYRLGGSFLVPIDSTDKTSANEILEHATIASSAVVRDSLAVLENHGNESLHCVVCVDTTGAVTEIWDANGARMPAALRTRVLLALASGWTFKAASTASRPACDCIPCVINLAAH